jgi:hypothetical protein
MPLFFLEEGGENFIRFLVVETLRGFDREVYNGSVPL